MIDAQRVSHLVEVLGEVGVDAFVTHGGVPMGYLSEFWEEGGERFMALSVSSTGGVSLICPALSESQARRCGIENVVSWKDGEDPLALFEALAVEWNLKSGIVAVDPAMPSRMLLRLQDTLPAVLFKDGEDVLTGLMRKKDARELELMYKTGKIADDAFEAVRPLIRAGLTELEVEKLLSDAMAERGGTPVFCIAATGANAAEPHHLTDGTPLKEGDAVILDFGCDVEGYKSDITRTVSIGPATDRAKEMYDLVYRAHMAGRAAIRPGVLARDVDAAARKVIEDAGCGDAFFHRLGHGIGLQIHEAPNITASNDMPLAVGDCFSIEPGVYFAGELGIRIENIVTVTEDGHASFNADPSPTIIECG